MLRKLAAVALAIAPMLTILAILQLGARTSNNSAHVIVAGQQRIVLVSDFIGPSPQRYRLTETILGSLRTSLSRYRNAAVEVLQQNILVDDISDAQAEGHKHDADIVVWGSYETSSISLRITVLHPDVKTLAASDSNDSATTVTGDSLLGDLGASSIQEQISIEVTYVTLGVFGIIESLEKNWLTSIQYLSDALNESPRPSLPFPKPEIIYLYLGIAQVRTGEYRSAIVNLTEAIRLNPNMREAYLERGTAYAEIDRPKLAKADFEKARDLTDSPVP
jgi:tetratricopeptide (TPR) repeat protein